MEEERNKQGDRGGGGGEGGMVEGEQ